ncbi:MAG: tetratricopeptide repeat protein, partial [Bacteroidetes bacterium]|nr:tetratricopeptide repeat protein [Bacteroidota bacterium]
MIRISLILIFFLALNLNASASVKNESVDSLYQIIKLSTDEPLNLTVSKTEIFINANFTDNAKISSLITRFIDRINQDHDQTLQAKGYFIAGHLSQQKIQNLGDAIYFLDRAYEIATLNQNYNLMAKASLEAMESLGNIRMYDEALKYLFKLKGLISQHDGAIEHKSTKLYRMGWLYHKSGNDNLAIDYFNLALQKDDFENDINTKMHLYNTWGLSYRRLGDFQNALKAFQESYAIASAENNTFWKALVNG